MTMTPDTLKLLRARKQGAQWLCHCPVHSDRKASLSVRLTDEGKLLVTCFAGCDPVAVLRAIGSRRDFMQNSLRRATPVMPDHAMMAYIRETWRRCLPPQGTPVEAYLRSRGYYQPIPSTLRYHPALRHSETKQNLNAMVAAVALAPGHTVTAIHRTYLLPDGSYKSRVEPNRMMLGRVSGGAVRLSPAEPLMAVAEGIETALSVQQATGIPTWAALTAGGIEKLVLPPLPLASNVVIAADNDASMVGQNAAHEAARRWTLEGRTIRIAVPPKAGADFNDLLRGGQHV